MNPYIELEDRYYAPFYSKRPIVLVRGKGARVWDVEGKEYIDCVGGYGTVNVGHCHPEVVKAVKEQAERMMSCPSTFYNDVRAKLCEKLVEVTPKPLERVFLCNSGTEAVEAALKMARRYTGKKEFIAMKRSFHGRTMGSLSATWRKSYREPFEPLVPGFRFVEFGDPSAVEAAINRDTAAVIVEPVQGEGGVYPAPPGYLKALRDICDDKGVLLILDEVQTGFGRTGRMFALEHWGVEPDILCLGKSIAGGVPMGATVTKPEVMESLKRGEHGSTFGGNPLACAAALATINVLLREDLPGKAREKGEWFIGLLRRSLEGHKAVREIRGLGLMVGVELKFQATPVLKRMAEMGVLALAAGKNVVRFLPPLVISKEDLKKAAETLEKSLEVLKNPRG